MYGDPAGLLQRIPELRPLCEDPRVRRAVESGDPFRVYRVLALAWLLRRLPEHRETLSLLLHRRRLFARPLSGNPTLFTLNSVGVGFVGESEREPDGTHVTTHCLVALFAVPLFPLGAYLVQAVPGQGALGRSSWRIFARVPLGMWTWLWSRGLALAAMLAVVAGGAQAVRASRYKEVTVLNGFPVPVVVHGAAQRLVVPAGGRTSLTLPVGTQQLRAEGEDGVELEAFSAEVLTGRRELVWNVAGAAPLYREEVVYQSERSNAQPAEADPRPTLLCGERWVEARGVDYAFEEPPRSIQMSKGVGRTVKLRLDVAQLRAGEEQASFCEESLLEGSRPASAMGLLEARAALARWKGPPATLAANLAALLAPERALDLARRHREAEPDELEANREYQSAAEAAGRAEEVLAEYRARALAAPESAQAQYLAARLAHGPELERQAERALARFPEDANLLHLAIVSRLERGEWAGVIRAREALASGASAEPGRDLGPVAVALVASGRAAEASSLVAREFEGLRGSARRAAAVLYAHLQALQGQGDRDRLLVRLEAGELPDLTRLAAGLPPEKPPESTLGRFLLALPRDPARALQLAQAFAEPDLMRLGMVPAEWLLVFAEAIRVGDEKARASLGRVGRLDARTVRALERYIRSGTGELEELDLTTRAVARFVRSRTPALAPMERQALVAAARKDDVLHTAVTEAIESWPPPASGR